MKMIEDSFVRFCVWINGPLINTVTLHLRLWNKADCVNHCFCENCHGGVRFSDLFHNSIIVVLFQKGANARLAILKMELTPFSPKIIPKLKASSTRPK